MKGMAMMLESFGINPEKIQAEFTAFTTGVKTILMKIQEELTTLKTEQAELKRINTESLKLLQELTAWQRIQKGEFIRARSLPSMQESPQLPLMTQPERPQQQQGPPNGQQNPPNE